MATLLLILALAGDCEWEPRPVVFEQYDAVVIARPTEGTWSRVLFIRDGKVLATRIASEDMQFQGRDGGWILEWRDYWAADRVIQFKLLATVEYDPPDDSGGEWWAMQRNMVDLAQPEAE